MKNIAILPLLFGLSAFSQAHTASDHLSTYKTQAEELMAMIESKKIKGIEAKADALVETSKPIVNMAKSKYPQCTEYFDALIQAADVIPTLSLDEIETGYHSDGKLPPLKDGNCYHVKDLLVHAATVQAMARIGINSDKGWDSAEHEIEEVIEHFDVVESSLESISSAH